MNVLLDTHALLWWLAGDERLSTKSRLVMDNPDNGVLVSAASAWEICTKARLGKLAGAEALSTNVLAACIHQGFVPIDITFAQAERAGRLPGPHRDPFDRMLAAQAQEMDMPIVSNDVALDGFGVRRIW